MKTIIAGSRNADFNDVKDAVASCPWQKEITEVFSGEAPGADRYGEKWAREADILVVAFPAAWDDLEAPGAVITEREDGTKYNKNAGLDRNQKMADAADALIAVWDGRIRSGTSSMIQRALKRGLRVHIYNYVWGRVVTWTTLKKAAR